MGIRIPVTQAEPSTPKNITAVSSTPSPDLTPRNVVEPKIETPESSGTGMLNIPNKDLDEVFGESVADPVDSIKTEQRTVKPAKLNVPDYVKDEVFGPMPKKDPLILEKVLARDIDLKQTKSTREIAERLNISMDEASALLSQSTVEEIRADQKLKDIETKHPGLLTWSRNPDNLKLLQNDPDYYLRLSSKSKQFDPNWIKKSQNFAKDSMNILTSGMAQMNASVVRLGSSIYSLGALPQNLIAENFNLPGLRADVPKVLIDNSVTKYYDNSAKYFSQKVDLNPDFFNTLKSQVSSGDYAGAGRNIFLSAIQSAPQQMLTILGAMTGYSTPTLIGMGFLQGTQTLKEGLDAGAPTGKATLNAAYAGAFEALMENLGTVGAFKKWEGLIYRELGKVEGRKVMREFVKTMAYSAAAEGNEELWTSVGQDSSAYATGVNMKALEGIWGRAAGAGILGSVSGATMTAPSALGSAYYLEQQKKIREGITKRINTEALKAQQAKAAKETMEQMREDKKTSSAAKDHPQQTEEFVDTNVNNPEGEGPQSNVKFTVKEFNDFAKSLGEDPMTVANNISPTFASEFKKAMDSDLPQFEVPFKDYHRNTDDYSGLDDIAVFNDNTYNAKEAEDTLKTFEDVFTKFKEESQRFNMQVFHGTPYDFDSFSEEAIGTGEGNTAFGYGLYFTEDEDIADWYRVTNLQSKNAAYVDDSGKELSSKEIEDVFYTEGGVIPTYAGFSVVEKYDKESKEVTGYAYNPVTKEKTGPSRKWYGGQPRVDDVSWVMKDRGFKRQDRKGNVYKVEVPTKEAMIPWREKFEKFEPFVKQKLIEIFKDEKELTGLTGQKIYEKLTDIEGGDREASKRLLETGIPGIRYEASKGSSAKENVVIFSDKLAKIVKSQRFGMQGGDPSQTPKSDENVQYINPDEVLPGDTVLRPIRLLQLNRSEDEKKVFESLRASLTKTTQQAGIDDNVADLMAEIQFNHLRFRSEVMGKSITEIHKEVKIGLNKNLGYKPKEGIAYFEHSNNYIMPRNSIIFGPLIKANAIVHEFAHSWLHNMYMDFDLIEGIPERTPEQENYYQAILETAKMFGLKSIKELYYDRARSTKIHETFAQTAEKYLLEGNFKDSKLRIIFEGMRKWMAQIAHIVGKAYAQFPPLKLSPQVQRVFQTIITGSSRAEAQVGEMFPPALFDEAILGANAEAYMKAIMDSRDEAIAQMYFKFFNKSFKEREKMIDEALNNIYDEAEKAIDARPSMIIMRSILEEGDAGRITYESVIDVLYKGDEMSARDMLKNIPKKIIAGKKKAGVDVRDIMLQLNITDIEHMKDMLHEMSRRDDMIEDMANGLMEEKFPMFKDDNAVHDEAVMAVNNQGRAKVLELELKILAEEHLKTLQKMSATVAMPPDLIKRKSQEVLKQKASMLVLKQNALRLNPWSLHASANRFGRLAAEFVKKGDYLSAFEMKENEAINHFAFKQASALQRKIDKYKNDIKRMGKIKPLDMGRQFDADIYQYGQLVLRAVTAGKPIPLMDIGDYPMTTVNDSDIDAINTFINAINQAQEGISADGMNVQTFMYLGQALKLIRKLAAEQKRMEVGAEKAFVEEVATEIASDIGERREGDPTEDDTSKYSYQWNTGLQTFRNFFVGLGVKDDSRLMKLLNSVADAEAKKNLEKSKDDQAIANAASLAAKDNPEMQSVLDSIKRRLIGVIRPDKGKPIPAPEVDFIFANKGEVLKALLYWGSDSGRIKLAMGGLMSNNGKRTKELGYWDIETGNFMTPELDAMFNRMLNDGTISKNEMEFVNTVWRINERHYEAVKASIRKVQGRNIGKVGGRKIETPWGTYDGGYIALRKHDNMMDQELTLDAMSVDNPAAMFSKLFPFTNTSMANERLQTSYPLSLDLSTIRRDLNDVYKVAYLLPSMHQVGKIFKNEKFQKALQARRPGAMSNYVEPWFVRTMSQKYLQTTDVKFLRVMERAVATLRKNMRVVAFLGNIKSVLKQPLGIIPAASVVKAKYLQTSLIEVTKSPQKMIKQISEVSPRMRVRFLNNEKNAVRDFEDFSMNEDPIAKSAEQVQKATFFFIQVAQNFTDAVVFNAAVRHAKYVLNMKSDKEIYDFATNVVIDTQGSTDISQVPAMLNSNVFMRLLTDFLPQVIAMFGLNYRDLEKNRGKPFVNRLERQAFMLIMTALIPNILSMLINNLDKVFDLGEDETAEEIAEQMMWENFKSLIETRVPVVGRLAVSAVQNPRNPLGGIPAGRYIGQIATTVGNIAEAPSALMEDGELNYTARDFYALLDGITLTTGIPIAVLNRPLKTLIDPNE